MLTGVGKSWWLVLLRGILAVMFGIMAFASPIAAAQALVWVFGVYALVNGLFALALRLRNHGLSPADRADLQPHVV